MNAVFADTSFYVALLSPSDVWHSKAREVSDQLDALVVTTEYVLIELGSALSRRRDRPLFIELMRQLERDEGTEIILASKELFRRGMSLFARHDDKDWSLVDCISLAVMKQRRLTSVLTADHHFEQAGHTIQLR